MKALFGLLTCNSKDLLQWLISKTWPSDEFITIIQQPLDNMISMDMILLSGKNERYNEYLLKLLSESLINRPRKPRINPRVIKIKMSKFKKKRKADVSVQIDFDSITEILSPPQNEAFRKNDGEQSSKADMEKRSKDVIPPLQMGELQQDAYFIQGYWI